MRCLRACSLLTVWLFLAGSAFATTPPATPVSPRVSPAVPPVTETSGEHHATHKTGPIVVDWHFKNVPGSAKLTVHPDGTYRFSGSYTRKLEGGTLEVLLGLKSSLGGVYLFHYTGNISHGGVQWSKRGKSAILKDDFKTFNTHDWFGSYRFHLTAEGKTALQQRKEACKDLAERWHLPDSWTGGITGHCLHYELVGHSGRPEEAARARPASDPDDEQRRTGAERAG